MDIFSRSNTQALRGIAALGILLFHVLLGLRLSPLVNMLEGLFVAVFLVLSGFELEESYRQKGLGGFWPKRLEKVVLPTVFFVCAYNYLFSFLPLGWDTSAGAVMHKCLDELLYVRPLFWFIFFILKCYAVYWVGTRFMGERWRWLLFAACALLCLGTKSPSGHLEAEQSLSFLAGVVLSCEKERLRALSERKMLCLSVLLLLVGGLFFVLKQLPPLHALKGSVGYHFLLCPFRLTTGLAAIPLLTLLRPGRSGLLQTAGKFRLEIYIAHIPFIGLVKDGRGMLLFLTCSLLSFFILLAYRRFAERRLGVAEVLFVGINAVFVAKYLSRLSVTLAPFATLAAVGFYYALLRVVEGKGGGFKIQNSKFKIQGAGSGNGGVRDGEADGRQCREARCGRATARPYREVFALFCIVALAGMLAMQLAIDPYSLQVDRWSALHFPIQNLLHGIYPYGATTHLGGNASPFPVWQVLHIPFYLLGNVGLSFFVAAGLFLWSSRKVLGPARATAIGLLLVSSVGVWYEAAVRSDLITNMLLVASLACLCLPRLSDEWAGRHGWQLAVAVGLLACTRVIVLLPLGLLFFPHLLKMRLRRAFLLTVLAVAVFVLTFVPFALWDWQQFFHFQNNPWALQTRQGNPSDFLLFLPLALYLALSWRGIAKRYYRNSSVMLTVFVVVTFVHNMYRLENWDLFSSTFDITYLSTALPFCLLSIGEETGGCVTKH